MQSRRPLVVLRGQVEPPFESFPRIVWVSAPVSVLVSFAAVQRGSRSVAMPVIAASRCGLTIDDRPRADLESVWQIPAIELALAAANVGSCRTCSSLNE
jgi:hypothetical protein